MTAKTADRIPNLQQGESDLDAAQSKLDQLRADVIAGSTKIGASHIADARAAVDFAELRVQLARDTVAHQTEQARLARINSMVENLTSGDIAAKGRRVIDLEAKAVAAIEALYLAADDYYTDVLAVRNELTHLAPLPEHVTLATHASAPVVVNGVIVMASYGWNLNLPGNLLRGAVYTALRPHLRTLTGDARALANETEKVLAGNVGGPQHTPAELLADNLDRLQQRVP